jgi:hypothetical protein
MKTKTINSLTHLKKQLKSGMVYRRADLLQWSNAVDRHLQQLLDDGFLIKLSGGLYYRPKKTIFGEVPADDKILVRAFLNDHRFLLTSPNLYNTLGIGTTQLYNETLVYNHKRHGLFKLGSRTFRFAIKPSFPSEITHEFLLVDVINNIDRLAEDKEQVLKQVLVKMRTMNKRRLAYAFREYGSVAAKKIFANSLINAQL